MTGTAMSVESRLGKLLFSEGKSRSSEPGTRRKGSCGPDVLSERRVNS